MQAKDIPDTDVLNAVRAVGDARGGARWCFTWDLVLYFPSVPWKVVQAKCKALIRRKLMKGCGCGCRGDFELTEAGRALVADLPALDVRTAHGL